MSVTALGCARSASEPAPPPSSIQIGHVRAFAIPGSTASAPAVANAPPNAPSNAPSSLALQGPQLGVELSTAGRTKGAIVGVHALTGGQGKSAHEWEELRPMLSIDGVLVEPQLRSAIVRKVGDRPALQIDAVVERPGSKGAKASRIGVRRIVRIADVQSVLRISTTVRVEQGAVPAELQVVERIAWGGGFPSVPGVGPLSAAMPVDTEWVGRTRGHRALVIAPFEGSATVVGQSDEHARVDRLTFTDVRLPVRKISDKRSSPTKPSSVMWTAEAVLSISESGLAQAVRQLGWVRGKPFTEAVAMLSTHPPDTEVRVVLPSNGQIVVSGVPDAQLRVILPLPDSLVGKPLLVGARARGVEASEWLPLQGPPYATQLLTVPDTSSLSVLVQHAGTGEPLPARIRILPRRSTRMPNLGPDWEASGALDTLITPSGRASIRLAAGYYRVIVTHGPEWSVVDQPIEIDVGKTTEVRAQLERAVDPGAWVPCELHVHSAPSSDSQVTLEDRVASLVAEGIAFAVPTDHNHVTDLSAAIRTQPLWGLASVPGVEVTTDAPIFGHFNAYPFPVDPSLPGQGAPEYRGRSPAEMFAELHAVGPDVVVQVNHPRIEGGIGYFSVAEYDSATDQGGELWSDDFDALEVWNGFDLARWANVQTVFTDWLALNEHGHRIVATGSSDSHTIRSEGAGYPRTYVRAPLAGVGHGAELVRSLREGRAFVTSGPFLSVSIGSKSLGDSVELAAPNTELQLEVFVQVAAWMQVSTLRVYLGTTLLRSTPLGSPTGSTAVSRRYQRTLSLLVDRPGPLVVAVEGEVPLDPIVARRGVKPFAFTNPIWLVRPGEAPPPIEDTVHDHEHAHDQDHGQEPEHEAEHVH